MKTPLEIEILIEKTKQRKSESTLEYDLGFYDGIIQALEVVLCKPDPLDDWPEI